MNWKSKYGNNHSINSDISLNLCANLTIKCNHCRLWHTAEKKKLQLTARILILNVAHYIQVSTQHLYWDSQIDFCYKNWKCKVPVDNLSRIFLVE